MLVRLSKPLMQNDTVNSFSRYRLHGSYVCHLCLRWSLCLRRGCCCAAAQSRFINSVDNDRALCWWSWIFWNVWLDVDDICRTLKKTFWGVEHGSDSRLDGIKARWRGMYLRKNTQLATLRARNRWIITSIETRLHFLALTKVSLSWRHASTWDVYQIWDGVLRCRDRK